MSEPRITLLSVLFLLGAAQAVFFAFTLFSSDLSKKKTNKPANRYLAMLLLVFSIDLLSEFLDHSLYGLEYFRVMVLIFPTDFLYGPLLWLYTANMTDRRPAIHWQNALHLIPTLILMVIIWPLAFQSNFINADFLAALPELAEGNQIQAWISNTYAPYAPVFGVVQIFSYLFFSLRQLSKHRNNIDNEFSFHEGVSLDWLRWLLYALTSLYLLYVIRFLIADFIGITDHADIVLNVYMVIVIYSMAYFGARQPRVFYPLKNNTDSITATELIAEDSDQSEQASKPTTGKYQKSALSIEISERILKRLNQAMETEKPYLNSNLTLPGLAKSISTSPNYLSQVINEQMQMNFFDYINTYRIETAKLLMTDPPDHISTILDVAMESAFNSKSAFYSAFKKQMNITPSQYKKSLSL
ncbi:MAG: helix-turn-helix transcriptional regulator [Gammaproteobacteria bacterium]|nr:helix-turn-helix transcriptional regulator [Gammaproteobacteria bacterium]